MWKLLNNPEQHEKKDTINFVWVMNMISFKECIGQEFCLGEKLLHLVIDKLFVIGGFEFLFVENVTE